MVLNTRNIQSREVSALQRRGRVVLAAIERNGTRPSYKGIGIHAGKVMYTLNGTEVHRVVVCRMRARQQDCSVSEG